MDERTEELLFEMVTAFARSGVNSEEFAVQWNVVQNQLKRQDPERYAAHFQAGLEGSS